PRAPDGPGDLALVAAAGAGDPARPDLAAIRHELAQGRDVLVVDLLDLVAAVLARLAPAARRAALAISTARWAPVALLGQVPKTSFSNCAQAVTGRASARV